MNFASPIFLFAFLPLVLIAYHLLRPIRAKNVLLIAAGLVFYASAICVIFRCCLHPARCTTAWDLRSCVPGADADCCLLPA